MAHPSLAPTLDLAAAAAGDLAARAAVVAALGTMVWGVCVRSDPSPEDAYQEAWEKILRALPRFDPHGTASLRTWARTITHRHLIDRHRRRRVRGEVLPFSDPACPRPGAEHAVSRLELQAQLDAALSALPGEQRRAVVFHHVEGMSLAEIAVVEGVSTGTLKSRLHRARARLARSIGGTR